jgi:orsellinic acid C2-O-methyltransferase
LLAAVLAHCAGTRGVLFDQAHAIAHAPALLLRAGVASRCDCVTGSFFESVLAGGDLYLLKSVLHNWDDERCTMILRHCKQAMLPDARVLVIERLVAEPLGTGAVDRDVARSDLTMLAALTGRERTRADFDSLLAAAGLRLIAATATGGPMAVMEARRA